jgi:ubiquinone/menaquinone biosynthesis C-methylase UbiE
MTLSHEQAKTFYDRFGRKQDWQRVYEDLAIERLVTRLDLGRAGAVLEFGCGTGRLAERLLERCLPSTANYLGIDVSTTMTELSRRRLAPFGSRVTVVRTDGAMRLPVQDGSFDRFVSTYVLDLLSERDITVLLEEAARVLVPGGLVGLVSLAPGRTLAGKVLGKLWTRLFDWQPGWVGGCRPILIRPFLDSARWQIVYETRVSRLGITSQVLVACLAVSR